MNRQTKTPNERTEVWLQPDPEQASNRRPFGEQSSVDIVFQCMQYARHTFMLYIYILIYPCVHTQSSKW